MHSNLSIYCIQFVYIVHTFHLILFIILLFMSAYAHSHQFNSLHFSEDTNNKNNEVETKQTKKYSRYLTYSFVNNDTFHICIQKGKTKLLRWIKMNKKKTKKDKSHYELLGLNNIHVWIVWTISRNFIFPFFFMLLLSIFLFFFSLFLATHKKEIEITFIIIIVTLGTTSCPLTL